MTRKSRNYSINHLVRFKSFSFFSKHLIFIIKISNFFTEKFQKSQNLAHKIINPNYNPPFRKLINNSRKRSNSIETFNLQNNKNSSISSSRSQRK